MKPKRTLLLSALATVLCLGAWNTRALHEFSAGVEIRATADFYAPLGDVGVWVDVGNYGRCWHPRQVARGWRPYSDGYWVWTDVGWYWVSDESWAWATYHYGRWVHDSHYGWVWVPDVEWGPAWVSWRYGGGYCGWAPLPPRVGFSFDISPSFFVFVELGHFHNHHRPSTVIVNNTTIVNKTVNITNIRQETKNFGTAGSRQVYVNEGPKLTEIQKATGSKVRTEKIDTVVSKTPVPKAIREKSSQRIETAPREQREQPKVNEATPQKKLEPTGRPESPREQRDQPKVKTETPGKKLEPTGRPDSPRVSTEQPEQPKAKKETPSPTKVEPTKPKEPQRVITPPSHDERIEPRAREDRFQPPPAPPERIQPREEPRPAPTPPGQLKKSPQPGPAPNHGHDPEKEKKERP